MTDPETTSVNQQPAASDLAARLDRLGKRAGFVLQQIAVVILLLLIGDMAIGAAFALKDKVAIGPYAAIDQRYRAPIYKDDPDNIAYWKEFVANWGEAFAPYYHWRRKEFHGRFINIDADGVRATPKPPLAPNAKKIFVFGGSTTWGTGAKDGETYPALLQAALGGRYDVTNYGETAYVSTQEVIYLMKLLADGKVPDIVIFYDGVNDGYAGVYSPAVPRDPHGMRAFFDKVEQEKTWSGLHFLIAKSNYAKLAAKLTGDAASAATKEWDKKVEPKIAENAAKTLDDYEANIRQVRALGAAYGFKSYFFWQPHLLSGTRAASVPFETRIIERQSPVMVESQRALYELAKKRLSGREDENIYFLGNIFDDFDGPLYIDWHHVGVGGNRVIADEMKKALERAGAVSP